MTEQQNHRKNQTARSESKPSVAPADCVQMIGSAKTKLATITAAMSSTTTESRLEA